MPFAKYLQHRSNDEPEPTADDDGQIQFQIPSFMYSSGPPMLALGGGAEVLPFNSTWFTNSGFSPVPVTSPSLTPIPPHLGLPVYSASGFDVLSILARIASRPNPRVVLGPVDMTCSFTVVDIRRHDHPVVYCSQTFCRLTGYREHEILGRNCRFLQAPGGAVRRGELRRFTSQDSVNTLHKALSAGKEVQTSIVNYRKDGSPFLNLISVIPIPGGVTGAPHEFDNIVYHVGFQVDLTEKPNAAIERLRDDTYTPNHSNRYRLRPGSLLPPPPQNDLVPPIHRKVYVVPNLIMSSTLAPLVKSNSFLRSLPTTTPTNSLSSVSNQHSGPSNNTLSLLLLEYSPDFMHVVSLKGAFLYVAPSITHVLGYLPSDLVGKSMADLAHPEDVVPLERQLKESSILQPNPTASPGPLTTADEQTSLTQAQAQARIIDVLFRARTKDGFYVWVECRGRLHVEPGKGRKAIILSARARAMPNISWGDIMRASRGFLSSNAPELGAERVEENETNQLVGQKEFWAMLSGQGYSAGALVGLGASVRSILGYSPEELIGRRIVTLMVGREGVEAVREVLAQVVLYVPNSSGKGKQEANDAADTATATTVYCQLRTKSGGAVRVLMVFYCSSRGKIDPQLRIAPAPVLLQVRLLDSSTTPTSSNLNPVVHPLDTNIFGELEVSRESSWQYELQQLRFANRRLREEVEVLEAEDVARNGKDFGHSQEHEIHEHETPILSSPAPQPDISSSTVTSTDQNKIYSGFIPLPTSASEPATSPVSGVYTASTSLPSLSSMSTNHALEEFHTAQNTLVTEGDLGLNSEGTRPVEEYGLEDHMILSAAPTSSSGGSSSRQYHHLPHRLQTPGVIGMANHKQQQHLQQHHQPVLPITSQSELFPVYAPIPVSVATVQQGTSLLIQAMNHQLSEQLQQSHPPEPPQSNQNHYYNQYPPNIQAQIQSLRPRPLPLSSSHHQPQQQDWGTPPSTLNTTTGFQRGVKRHLGC